jgi:hypothetical protein
MKSPKIDSVSPHLLKEYKRRCRNIFNGGKLNKRKATPMFKQYYQMYAGLVTRNVVISAADRSDMFIDQSMKPIGMQMAD